MQPTDPLRIAQQPALHAWQEALLPLLEVVERDVLLSLWVNPQGVVYGARAAGEMNLGLALSTADFAACWAGLEYPWCPSGQVTVCRLAGQICMQHVPDNALRPEDLALQGWLSPVAARTLEAALALGRNIVWTGPHGACCQLMASLAEQGRHPGLWLGRPAQPVPSRWIGVHCVSDVILSGVDRLTLWGVTPKVLAQALTAVEGAQGWLQAGRLDRVLMRLELATATATAERAEAALHILAGVDLVVVMAAYGPPRVLQVAELKLAQEGYRPTLLFATGDPIAPHALVPVALPTFYDELGPMGHGLLAEDLLHAVASGPGPTPPKAASPQTTAPPPHAPIAMPVPQAPAPAPAPAPRSRTPLPDAAPQSQPGWELDRLLATQPPPAAGSAGQPEATPPGAGEQMPPGAGEQTLTGAGEQALQPGASTLAEAAAAAAMAAQFGLAPPPRPVGQRAAGFKETLALQAADPGLSSMPLRKQDEP